MFDRVMKKLDNLHKISHSKWFSKSKGLSMDKIIERVQFAKSKSENINMDVELRCYWHYVELYWYNVYNAKKRKYEIKHPMCMYFENKDIVITDPTFFINDESVRNEVTTERLEYPPMCIYDIMVADTLFGDWGCSTYNDLGECIGSFVASSGLVSVADLDNPIVDRQKLATYSEYCMTVIKNFTGVVYIKRIPRRGYDDEIVIEGEGSTNFHTCMNGW